MGLLQRSITAGILIASILVLRRFAFRKLSKRVFASLWKVALLRLLLPFSFQVENALFGALFGKNISRIMLEGQGGNLKTEAAAEVSIGSFLVRNIGFIYLLVALSLALFFALGYIRVSVLLKEAIPVSAFGDIGMSVGKDCRGLTGRVGIVVMDRIKTPMTYGLLHPRIVLPKSMDWKDENMLSFVFRHEMAHIKSMDNWWKLLALGALCLHWFNPLVLVLYFLFNKDIEIACDESVISAMDEKERQRYALTLVVLAEHCASLAPMTCSGFGKSAVSERIREIMNYKKVTKIGSICGAFLLLGSMAVFVSAKGNTTESAPPASVEVMGESAGSHEGGESAVVYFDVGITEERKEEIGGELLALDGVAGIEYTSADEAWAMFAKEYLSEDELLSFKGENPLKDSANFTVYFTGKKDEIIPMIQGIEGVRRVACN